MPLHTNGVSGRALHSVFPTRGNYVYAESHVERHHKFRLIILIRRLVNKRPSPKLHTIDPTSFAVAFLICILSFFQNDSFRKHFEYLLFTSVRACVCVYM